MKLETERLLLEPLRPTHARFLFKGLQDPILYRFIPQDPPAAIKKIRENYRRWNRGAPADRDEIWLNWALRLRRKTLYIGHIQSTVFPKKKSADIAYTLLRKFWGNGYAKEACARMIQYLSSDLGVRVVRATMDTRNRSSVRLAQNLGLRKKKLRRRADFFKGSPSDEYVFEAKVRKSQ